MAIIDLDLHNLLYELTGEVDAERWLKYAAKLGRRDVVAAVIGYGARDYNEAAAEAARNDRQDVLDYLISLGASDLNLFAAAAADHGHERLVNHLIESGADNYGLILFGAAKGGYIPVADSVLGRMDIVDMTGKKMAMVAAARFGHLPFLMFMISRYSHRLSVPPDYDLMMAAAARGGHPEIINVMIARGANNFRWAMSAATEAGNFQIADDMRRRLEAS